MGQLEDMQVFIRVVEAGGIGRAAEQLGIAKSAVSRRLSELEARLGTQLITRTTRTSSLTEAGQRYYQQALKVVDQVHEMNTELADADAALSGSIRLAVPLSFGLLHMGPAIDLFVREHPQVSIHMDFSDRQVDMVEEGFDLALRIADLKDSSMQAKRICPSHYVLAASPDYILRHGSLKQPSDIINHDFLKYGVGSSAQWPIIDAKGKEQRFNVTAKITANNGDFLLQMARAGHGIVVLPTFIAWQALAAGELVQVLEDCTIPSLDAYVVYPQNRFLPKRSRALIDFMAKRFGDEPYWDKAI